MIITLQLNQEGFDSLNVWLVGYEKDGTEKEYLTSIDSLKKRHPRITGLIRNAWLKGKSHVSIDCIGYKEIQWG